MKRGLNSWAAAIEPVTARRCSPLVVAANSRASVGVTVSGPDTSVKLLTLTPADALHSKLPSSNSVSTWFTVAARTCEGRSVIADIDCDGGSDTVGAVSGRDPDTDSS